MTLVIIPLAFIYATIFVHLNTDSLSQLPAILTGHHESTIHSIFVLFDTKMVVFAQFVVVKLIGEHLVLLDSVTFVLKLEIFFGDALEASVSHFLFDGLPALIGDIAGSAGAKIVILEGIGDVVGWQFQLLV